MLADTPEAELRTHLFPFVIVGLIGAWLGGWHCLFGEGVTAFLLQPMYYAALGLLLFGASSLYHLAKADKSPPGGAISPREALMNKLDHTGIHMMIAGTGTLHMTILPSIRDDWVPALLGALWALAAVGVAHRSWFWRESPMNKRVMWVIYGAMAATILPAIELGSHFWDGSMLVAYVALAVYGASLLAFRKGLHSWWHVGVVTAYVLAGVPIFL